MLVAAALVAIAVSDANAQSSSLYLDPPAPVQTPARTGSTAAVASPVIAGALPGAPVYTSSRGSTVLSKPIARASLISVQLPEPRKFAIHDLVTIIVSERSENKSDTKLDVSKESTIEGEIKDIPNLELKKLLDLTLQASNNPNPPKVGIELCNEFSADGKYSRKDTMTARITARIIDIKPNGNMVLEARKYIRSDKESLSMTITGTCRPDDVTSDNTLLSTQLSDLRVAKEHDGELKKTTKKGIITKLFETIFNF